MALSYGDERLRFIRPAFIGDTLTARTEIVEKRDHKKPGYGLVNERLSVTNQAGDTVLVADHLLLVERRDPPKPEATEA